MTKLTKRSIDTLAVPQKGQTFKWDNELRGFGVRATPSGLKSFILQYRNAEGRSRRMVIGRYGILTVEQAREKAKVQLGTVADGVDLAAERMDRKQAMTVAEVCDWYLAEATTGRILGRRNRPIKASTLTMDRSRIERHIKPLLGKRIAQTLKIADIEAMQSDIVAGKTAKPRGTGRGGVTTGGPGVASRSVATLQSILSHAARLDMIDSNPSLGVRKIAGKKKERRLSVAEIKKLGEAIRFGKQHGEHPTALAVVEFLLLTGYRISEAQGLQRGWLHSGAGCVHFPDTKSDSQVRAIGPPAIKLVQTQPIANSNPYIFPSDTANGHFTAGKACLARLCHNVGIEGVTPHTLRHTFGSVAGDLGFSELTIRALLGHSARGVTQGYVHIDEALKLAVTRTSNEIAFLLNGNAF